MFRQKVLLRNLLRISKCQSKGSSVRTLKRPVLHVYDSQEASRARIILKSFNKNGFLQQNILENGGPRRYSSESHDGKCWKCHQILKLKKFCCAGCGALQQPKNNVNFFELFGISQTYDINLDDLSTKFKDLQKNFHPDVYAKKSKEELEIAEVYSRLVNKAYTTLKDPLTRGQYLLELHNMPQDTGPLAQEFLSTVMEKNEKLEGITSETTLEDFARVNSEDLEKQMALVSESFHRNKWDEARLNLTKLNYYMNLNTRIKKKKMDFTLSKIS